MTEFTEWRSLVDGAVIAAIPGILVDNWNNEDDEEEPGIYNDIGLSDVYSLDVDRFSRVTDESVIGDFALSRSDDGDEPVILSWPGDGLNRYPDAGETVQYLIKDPGEDLLPQPCLMAGTDVSSDQAYWFEWRSGEIAIAKHDVDDPDAVNANRLSSTSVSTDFEEYHVCEVSLPTSSDDEILYEVYEHDGDGEKGDFVDSVSANDNDLVGNRGVGFSVNSSSNTGVCFDRMRVID